MDYDFDMNAKEGNMKSPISFVGITVGMPATNGGFTMCAFNGTEVGPGEYLYVVKRHKELVSVVQEVLENVEEDLGKEEIADKIITMLMGLDNL